MQGEEPEKEEAPVTSVKKKKKQQAAPQDNVAVVQPVKTAATEVCAPIV